MVSGMDKKVVYKRIRQTKAYHEERLELLFGIIYRNPKRALEKWKQRIARSGFEKAFRKQRKKARALGKLKGRSLLGLYQSHDRQKTEHANAEFHKMARTWYSAVLEEEEADRLEHLQTEQATQEAQTQANEKMVEQARASVKIQLESIRDSDQQAESEDGVEL